MDSIIILLIIVLLFSTVQAASNVASNVAVTKAANVNENKTFKLGSSLTLAGEGIRSKGPIKVYSCGLYFDKNAVIKSVSSLKGKTASELLNSRDFENALINGNFNKNVILKMLRNVSGKTMATALSDSVKPKMSGKDSKQLNELTELLLTSLKDGAKTGMVLSFEGTSSSLTVKVNGNKKGSIYSPTLCKAFIDVYVGKDCVSSSLKSNLAKVVSTWL